MTRVQQEVIRELVQHKNKWPCREMSAQRPDMSTATQAQNDIVARDTCIRSRMKSVHPCVFVNA
jgi:hypothetical protein